MRQKHGQNFLVDLNIANNIVKAARLSKEDEVVEIGPGKGVLTKIIAPQAKRLTAVEIDAALSDRLKNHFNCSGASNVEIINADFLKLQSGAAYHCVHNAGCDTTPPPDQPCGVNSRLSSFDSQPPLKFISNLPYNVGTAIVQKILPQKNWSVCVFMLQKEVAHRLAAKPGGKDYGYISLFTQYYADAQILFDVSQRCFNPPPKVMSCVIKLLNKNPEMPGTNLFPFIKRAFSMRRKTILNCLSSFLNIEKTDAAEILNSCKINPQIRPDKMSLEDFIKLTACK
jgi:16S rRNA (adenine1518-N6/adenine1519-N6)-dimethyltransferase